jgi:hypothetical protein
LTFKRGAPFLEGPFGAIAVFAPKHQGFLRGNKFANKTLIISKRTAATIPIAAVDRRRFLRTLPFPP